MSEARLIQIDRETENTLLKIGGAVGFAAAYGAIESLLLEDFLKNIGTFQDPLVGELYPYHLLVMVPLFSGVAFILSFDKSSLTRTALNFMQTFPPLIVMEDIFYYIFQYFDTRHPETAGRWNLTPDAWTCNHMGCQVIPTGTESQPLAIPNWYLLTAGLSGAAWTIDNIMFSKRSRPVVTELPPLTR